MGARPTRSSISENLTSIVSETYLNFNAKCNVDADEQQLVDIGTRAVDFISPQGFPVQIGSSAGCLRCQQRINGLLMAEYEVARSEFGVGEGDPNEIERYSHMCDLVCADVWVTNLQQESQTEFTGECAITDSNHSEFIKECNANIMQSLESNGDFASAVFEAFGGGNDQETRNRIEQRINQVLSVDILAEMQTNLVASQEFRVVNSNSVYSSGISQQLLVSVCKSTLISNDFVNKVFMGTTIDQETDVRNDTDTLAAALAAIEAINRSFANAVGGGISLLAVLIGLLIAGASIMFLAIVIHIMAEKKKAELAALCPDLPQVSTLQMLKGQVREAKQLQAELKG